MHFGLVHFLNFDTYLIDQIRRKYDPTADLIAPHITILFAIPDKIKKAFLVDHIEEILKHWKSFPIHIRGFEKSWDHWLLLVLKEGNTAIKKLYHEMYSGSLLAYKRDDIQFIPHISLGLFVEEMAHYDYENPQRMKLATSKYRKALAEAKSLNLDFRSVFDRLQLIRLDDNFSQIEKGKEFFLAKSD